MDSVLKRKLMYFYTNFRSNIFQGDCFIPFDIKQSFSRLVNLLEVKQHVSASVKENSEAKTSEAKPEAVRKNNGALIIEDWVSDSEEENVSQTKIEKKIAKPSFVKIDFVKAKQTKLIGKLLNKLSTIGKTLIFLETTKETRII
ncbi:hypothetical protein Tco_1164003 [Tanacetum coccineum]